MIPSQFDGGERVVLLFPGALGDFLCFAEGFAGLRSGRVRRILLVARPQWSALLPAESCERLSIDSRAVAELFGAGELVEARRVFAGAGPVHSWTGHGDDAFLGRLRSLAPAAQVHPFRGFQAGEHAADYYARCLGVAPQPPGVRPPAAAVAWAAARLAALPPPLLAIHPGAGSAAKRWPGFAALVARWRERGGGVVVIEGPAEPGTGRQTGADLIVGESLPRIAAVLAACDVYAGNDSGVSHLAAAVGAKGVALFGATDPIHWRPRSARIRVLAAPGGDLERLPAEDVYAATAAIVRG